MQIERKPRHWPYVGALIALLVFCLTVPRYWRSSAQPATRHARTAPDAPSHSDHNTAYSGSRAYPRHWLPASEATPFNWQSAHTQHDAQPQWGASGHLQWQADAIQQLLEVLSARTAYTINIDDAFTSDHLPRTLTISSSPAITTYLPAYDASAHSQPIANASPNPRAASIFRRIGESLVGFPRVFVDCLPQITRQAKHWLAAIEVVASDQITPDVSDDQAQLQLIAPHEGVTIVQDWTTPEKLIAQLNRLAEHPYSAYWARQTLSLVTALTRDDQPRQQLTNALLRRIANSTEDAARLGESSADGRLRAELLRAHWSLARRLDCWAVLNDIRVATIEKRRVATRGALDAMFAGPPMPAEIPADVRTLNADLERYEQSRDPVLASSIAESRGRLQQSPDDLQRSLATAVEQHYRNANIRLAVTAEMLNRFVGEERSDDAVVRDRIAGAPVYGHSHTLSESRIHLQPDEGRWHMELEADGQVDSKTRSDGGPAQLYSRGETEFVARKTIIVAPEGIRVDPTVVSAYNRNRLVGVTTDFDWVPLFGSYARNMAINQYRAKRSQAKCEVEYTVAARAMEQLDRETLDRVDRLEQDIRDRFIKPLEQSDIAVTAVELTSTTDRVVARLRVAGDHQLGAHTPRPRALSDSLASAQLHETAFTNAAVALGLDGQQFTAPDLQAKLREAFPNMAVENPTEAHHDTSFKFARQNAVQVRFADGKAELLIAVDEFHHDGRRIRPFIVHAFYVPVVTGIEVELVRDGPLGFEGRLSSAERARLYSVFKEVLSEDRGLPILQVDDPSDARLTDLMVTQLVLEDGWLGMAIGPKTSGRTAERSRSLR